MTATLLRSRPTGNRTEQAERCIIFLHIPKTGGMTLMTALRSRYGSRMLKLQTLDKRRDTQLEALAEVPLSTRRRARLVSGHLYYGVHEYLPQECDYITLLREPVARVISYYYYVRGHPKHWFHDGLVRSDMSLEEFVSRAPDPEVANGQTRRLSGDMGEGGSGELGARALDRAKQHLARCAVVGLTERFDESFILIRRALGWRPRPYMTTNVSPTAKPATADGIELVRERNRLDLELYRYAGELLSAAVEEQGGSFRRELAAFKILNQVPNRIRPHTPAPVRRLLKALAAVSI
jgi:hypothetical protein